MLSLTKLARKWSKHPTATARKRRKDEAGPKIRCSLESLESRTLLSAGDLDLTFDGDGMVTTSVGQRGSHAHAVQVQPDGKIVAAGSAEIKKGCCLQAVLALVRYNADGSLDSGFGSSGKVTNSSVSGDFGHKLALQSDGKILAVGRASSSNGDFAVVRYGATGSLDSSFGSKGLVKTNFSGSSSDYARAVAIQADDGKIVVGGNSAGAFALARYDQAGALDTSFSGDGKVTTDLTGGADEIFEIAIQSDGKIVAAGRIGSATGYGVVRYNADGSLDASFGSGGVVTDAFSANHNGVYGMAIQPDGRIVLAGYEQPAPSEDRWALARYNSDGTLDATFDGDGKLSIDFGSGSNATAVRVQSDGQIVAAGWGLDAGGDAGFALARLNPDGSLDSTFGVDGKVTTDFGGNDGARDLAIQPDDGKIVVVGNFNKNDFAAARYIGDSTVIASATSTRDSSASTTSHSSAVDLAISQMPDRGDDRRLERERVSAENIDLLFHLIRRNRHIWSSFRR